MLELIFTLSAGLILFGFFSLVKYRDQLNKVPPQGYRMGYIPLYVPIGYQWVTRFVSTVGRQWLLYFLFFTIPYIIILLLLAGCLQRYTAVNSIIWYELGAVITALLHSDIINLHKEKYISEKILHISKIVIACTVALSISFLSLYINFSFIAPSVSGLFDNLWSTLTVAALAVVYKELTDPYTNKRDAIADEIKTDNYIVQSYNKIRFAFEATIKSACDKYECSIPILYSVLIYENMNRPKWFRSIENAIVRLTHKRLTVGIAQVRSNKPLTDEESIWRAAEILQGSNNADAGYGTGFVDQAQLEEILKAYNEGTSYARSITDILGALRKYTDAFPFSWGGPVG